MKKEPYAIIFSPKVDAINEIKNNMITLFDNANINNMISDLKTQGFKKFIYVSADQEEANEVKALCKQKFINIDLNTKGKALEFYANQLKRCVDAKLNIDQIVTILSASLSNAVSFK